MMNKLIRSSLFVLFLFSLLTPVQAKKKNGDILRLLYWNIQNGMWDGQTDTYDRFVDWVKSKNPDVCVWCEAASIYKTGTAERMDKSEKYLPENWGELAARYGHKYWFMGGCRDNYPQVITSRYPIRGISKIVGAEPDSVVTHGAGWAQIDVCGKQINIVTLHLWPMQYSFRIRREEQKADAEHGGGDHYRRMEIERICKQTILTVPESGNQYWMMMGDFNSHSPADNWVYRYPEGDSKLLVHDYIRACTPYLDVIAERYPDNFYSSVAGKSRIDYVYCTKPLFDRVSDAAIVTDSYTRPLPDPQGISHFWHPSDHRPILVDFNMNK